jgi:AbrB family looped-hinge helix DNA binding protein
MTGKETPMANTVIRVQEKGQVTIPLGIRKKLNLKKGDLVTVQEVEGGVLIRPAELIVGEALDQLGEMLKEKGMTLEKLIDSGREIRTDLLKEQYGITDTSNK